MKLEGRGPGLFNAGGGTMELAEDGVLINKKNTDLSGAGGILDMAISVASSSKGGLLLRYDVIHSVNISEGGWTSPPFIQVLTPGETPVSNHEVAMRTPSCLLFKKAMLGEFQAIKSEIEKRVTAAKARGDSHQIATVSIADEIAKLGKLLEAGLLTADEFAAKKKELLGT